MDTLKRSNEVKVHDYSVDIQKLEVLVLYPYCR